MPLTTEPKTDPGVDRVETFHRAFGLHIREWPTLYELSKGDRSLLRSWVDQLFSVARIMKAQAAELNGLHRSSAALILIRLQLQVEEAAEVFDAVLQDDIAKVLHELSDLSYVVDGTYLTFGLQSLKVAADEELHRANMSKLGPGGEPIIDAAGRVVRGAGYEPPDMERVLAENRPAAQAWG